MLAVLGNTLLLLFVAYTLRCERKSGGLLSKNPRKYKDDGYEGSRGAGGAFM